MNVLVQVYSLADCDVKIKTCWTVFKLSRQVGHDQ